MRGDHDARVFDSGGSLGQPAAAIVDFQQRLDPLIGDVRCHQRPELVQIPKSVPKRVAAIDRRCGIRERHDLLVHVDVFSVDVAPDRPRRVRAVEVRVELHLVDFVVALDFDLAEQIVPRCAGMGTDGVKVPAKGCQLGIQVQPGLLDADQRDTNLRHDHFPGRGFIFEKCADVAAAVNLKSVTHDFGVS